MSHLLNNNFGYNGNPRVKRDGVVQNFTQHEIEEYVKCSRDPSYFARKYIKVISIDKGTVPFSLYPYQEKMYERFTNNRFNIVLACRQSGKSTAVMGYLLWYALFHSEKNVAIAANKGAMAREILARITFALENLPFFLQPGCKTLNKGSIHFSNDTKIIACSTTSSALRGESVSCVTSDAKVTIEDDFGGIHFGEISNFINKSEFIETTKTYKYHVVYKTINLVNNKIYIGYHSTNNINDTYLGSGKWLRRAVEKYGPENFKREILHIFEDRETALKKEAELVDQTFVKRDDTYNLVPGGGTCILCGPDKKKRSMSLKGQKKSAEHVDKINRNPEKIRKTAEKHRGMKRSTEARMKMSISAKKRGPTNKGKVYCYDPNSKQTRMCLLEEIPKGWIRGFRPKEK